MTHEDPTELLQNFSKTARPTAQNLPAASHTRAFHQQATSYTALGSAWSGDGSSAGQKAYVVTETEN
jgi:hypothetical protein